VFSLTVGDIAGDNFGNSYLVHTEYILNGTTEVKKLDISGSILWDHVLPMAGNRIEVGNDNNAVISGYPNVNSFGAAFMKIDENGNQLWINPDADGPQGLFLQSLLLLDENNNAYLSAGTLFNMAVCKVNNDGTSAWTALTSNGGYAFSMALGNNLNSIFVVGGITARLNDETAPPVCYPPVNIFFNGITASTIKVNWDSAPGAMQYELWRKKSSGNNWKIQTVTGDKSFKKYKDLPCNTSFDFKIRSICDAAGTLVSAFSPIYSASTSPCKLNNGPVTESHITAYPNPASDYLTVDLVMSEDFTTGKIELVDVNGRTVLSQTINDPETESIRLDVAAFASGIYLLRVFDNQKMITVKVIIE
jgi:hypothetical protein